MLKVKEITGHIFCATLSDGSTLCLQAGEETTIKESLLSDSVTSAAKQGIISVYAVESEKTNTATNNKKTGGANK